MIERSFFVSKHLSDADLWRYVNSGLLEHVEQMAFGSARKKGYPVALVNEVIDWRSQYFDVLGPALIVAHGDLGLPQGLHLNPTIDDPTYDRKTETTSLYPLFAPFTSEGVVTCHYFPRNALFESIYFDKQQKENSRLKNFPPQLFTDRPAAYLFRAIWRLFNKPWFELWVDLTDPEKLQEVADLRNEKPDRMLEKHLRGKTLVVVHDGALHCYAYENGRFHETSFPKD